MTVQFFVAAAIAAVLLMFLIFTIMKYNAVKKDNERFNSDNSKLFSKVQKLESQVSEERQAKDNLASQHEELKEMYDNVNRVAYTDRLTELPNSTQFGDIFEGMVMTLREGETTAVSVIRLANYDRIANAGGHATGDELILDFTARLRNCLSEDDFLSRFDSDEFTVISQNFDDKAEFESRFAALYKDLSMPLAINGREIIPQIYIATAFAPADGKSTQLLSMNVRLALSKAILEGKKQVYYYDTSMASEAMKRMELTAGLNQAVESNSLNYLCGAQNDLRTGKISSFEILPVWEHEKYGTLYPADYLKFTEDTQIAKKLFSLLFRASCEKQKKFEAAGYGTLDIIVPCFVGQFIDDEFVKIVYNILEETDAIPQRIMISVPETVLLKNPEGTVALMRKIEKLGVRFILDEFGSGSSSLTALLTAPVSIVRLSDAIFSESSRIDPERFLISFVELIHSWKLKLIATDVDVEAQESILKRVHADYAQGQLYNGYMKDDLALQLLRMAKK